MSDLLKQLVRVRLPVATDQMVSALSRRCLVPPDANPAGRYCGGGYISPMARNSAARSTGSGAGTAAGARSLPGASRSGCRGERDLKQRERILTAERFRRGDVLENRGLARDVSPVHGDAAAGPVLQPDEVRTGNRMTDEVRGEPLAHDYDTRTHSPEYALRAPLRPPRRARDTPRAATVTPGAPGVTVQEPRSITPLHQTR